MAMKTNGGVVQMVALSGLRQDRSARARPGDRGAARRSSGCRRPRRRPGGGQRRGAGRRASAVRSKRVGAGRAAAAVAAVAAAPRPRDADARAARRVRAAAGARSIASGRPPAAPTVKDFVDHIDYAVKLIGVDHVGISSDFDGGGGIDGWNSAAETFNVTLEMVRRGYTEEQIAQDLERQSAARLGVKSRRSRRRFQKRSTDFVSALRTNADAMRTADARFGLSMRIGIAQRIAMRDAGTSAICSESRDRIQRESRAAGTGPAPRSAGIPSAQARRRSDRFEIHDVDQRQPEGHDRRAGGSAARCPRMPDGCTSLTASRCRAARRRAVSATASPTHASRRRRRHVPRSLLRPAAPSARCAGTRHRRSPILMPANFLPRLEVRRVDRRARLELWHVPQPRNDRR